MTIAASFRRPAAAGLAALLLAGCGADPASPPTPFVEPPVDAGDAGAEADAPSGCPPGEAPLDDGGCLPAGQAAGVAPDQCGEGFSSDGDGGCDPILPAAPCGPGSMAVPGDRSCHEVSPCASGSWGDAPIDATTQFVDATYPGADSDGTATKPWTTLQQGVDAASAGALVAVAEGTYAPVVIAGKAVRLWGRCPALVEIVATGGDAITVGAGADGAAIHGIAATGTGTGVVVSGASNVVVERTWIHDMAGRGASFVDAGGTLTGVLVESVVDCGIFAQSSQLLVGGSLVRGAQPNAQGKYGRGLNVQFDPATFRGADVTLRGSVLEQNHDTGLFVWAATVHVEASVVRETLPRPDGAFGWGIHAQADDAGHRSTLGVLASVIEANVDRAVSVNASDATLEATVLRSTKQSAGGGQSGWGLSVRDNGNNGEPAAATLRGSLVDDNFATAVWVDGSELTIESTILRATKPDEATGKYGRGLTVQSSETAIAPTHVTIDSSIVEKNHDTGIIVSAAALTMTSTLVRDTLPRESDQGAGRGLNVQVDVASRERASADVSYSVFERNRDVAVFVAASDVTLSGSRMEGTLPDASTGWGGFGAWFQAYPGLGPSHGVVSGCAILDSRDIGVGAIGSELTLRDSLVSGTAVREVDSLFGDGVAVLSYGSDPASASISRTRVEGSGRVGVSSFAAHVGVEASVLECNAVHLDGEEGPEGPFVFDDQGGNACGCKGAPVECIVLTSGLEAPTPIE